MPAWLCPGGCTPTVTAGAGERDHDAGCWFGYPLEALRRQRAGIDTLLAEDAAAHPAFAKARHAAVLAACEGGPRTRGEMDALLCALRGYEERRGVQRERPSWAKWTGRDLFALDAYERARTAL